jgi:protein involved in polysaccharide export with SLBB domain
LSYKGKIKLMPGDRLDAYKKEWPANHRIWKKFHEIRGTFEQRCLQVIGPDGAVAASLCAKHLRLWLDRMQSPGAL